MGTGVCLRACVSTACISVHAVPVEARRGWLELQVVVSHQVGTGTQTWVLRCHLSSPFSSILCSLYEFARSSSEMLNYYGNNLKGRELLPKYMKREIKDGRNERGNSQKSVQRKAMWTGNSPTRTVQRTNRHVKCSLAKTHCQPNSRLGSGLVLGSTHSAGKKVT